MSLSSNFFIIKCLPDKHQEYLLKASVSNDKKVVEKNLQLWKSNVNLDDIDYKSGQLLAFLNNRLSKFKINDNNLPRYLGIYKKNWVHNVELFKNFRGVIKIFNEAKIQYLITKGIVFSKFYYKDDGIFKIDTIDVFISESSILQSFELLCKNGWELDNANKNVSLIDNFLGTIKQVVFKNKNNYHIVLSLQPFTTLGSLNRGTSLYNNRQLLSIDEVNFESFETTHQLFFTIINGLTETANASLLWIPQALTILEKYDQQLNWNEFINCVKQYKVSLLSILAFIYLKQEHKANIPDNVIEKIKELPVHSYEKIEFNYYTNRRFLFKTQYHFLNYIKLRKGYTAWSELPLLKGYTLYLKIKLNANNNIEILKAIINNKNMRI